MTRRFWWKPKEKEGKFIAWKQWDKLCHPKATGGLGFKKTKEVNAALLAKLAWMVASGKQSICMEVLRTKYKVKEDWLRAEPKKIASLTWRAIEDAKNLVVKGACYLLGDGKLISVWEDPWIPWIEGFKPWPRIEVYSQLPFKAHHLFDPSSKTWDANMIKEIFDSSLPLQSSPSPSQSPQGKISLYGSPILKETSQSSLFTRWLFNILTAMIKLNPIGKIYVKLNFLSASRCSYGGTVPTSCLQR